MDALSNVLRTMHLTGGVFLHAEFFDPWCLSVKALPALRRSFPTTSCSKAACACGLPIARIFEMEPGKSVLFPRNDLHLLGSDLSRTPVDAQTVIERSPDGIIATIVFGGNGPRPDRLRVFGRRSANPKPDRQRASPRSQARHKTKQRRRLDWKHLPSCRRRNIRRAHWISGPHGQALGTPFVEAITAYAATLPEKQTGWLAGLRDPYLARAMALLHGNPAYPWTVEELAQGSGLSRSALAERFVAIIGMPPIQYLAAWRLNLAAYELLHTPKSILQVAQEVGYDTEAAFSRAFKRVIGRPLQAGAASENKARQLETSRLWPICAPSCNDG